MDHLVITDVRARAVVAPLRRPIRTASGSIEASPLVLLDVATNVMSVLYDGEAMAMPPIRGVDNLTVSASGDVLVAEDGGSMQIVAILPSGETRVLVQVVGQDTSEITGPAFDPSGTRLYFSSQRGPAMGTTYEITGPFHEPA